MKVLFSDNGCVFPEPILNMEIDNVVQLKVLRGIAYVKIGLEFGE
jgi:hypothetical protein